MADKPATPSPVKVTWLIGALAAFAIFALIAAYSRQMTYVYTDYSRQRAADRLKTLEKLQADENKQLNTLDWIDQDKKTIRIPIDTAMDKEIATLLLKPAAIGAALPVIAPPPAPAAAPASTNAAPAAPAPPATNGAPVNAKAPAPNAAPATTAPASTNAAPVKPKAPAKPKQ